MLLLSFSCSKPFSTPCIFFPHMLCWVASIAEGYTLCSDFCLCPSLLNNPLSYFFFSKEFMIWRKYYSILVCPSELEIPQKDLCLPGDMLVEHALHGILLGLPHLLPLYLQCQAHCFGILLSISAVSHFTVFSSSSILLSLDQTITISS